MAYLVDTNIFLRLANRDDGQRGIALNALILLRRRNENLHYTTQVLSEFWNVCTRPASARGGLGLSVGQTENKVRLIERYFQLLPDGLDTHLEWRRLVASHSVIGVQVYDARLVASMTVHGIQRMLTFNKGDFNRFTMIMALSPPEII